MLLVGLLLWTSTFFYTWFSGSRFDALLFSRMMTVWHSLAYRFVLKKRFRLHSVVQGLYQPMARHAVLLALLALPQSCC